MNFLSRAREFVHEVVLEFRRVTWPTRQDVMNATVVVIAVTVVLALFLGAVDVALAWVVERILR